MNRRAPVVALMFFFSFLSPSGHAEWLKGQAVTWTDFNYVSYGASSMSKVYFATTGGIIRYNKMESRWEDPLTGAEGLLNQEPQRIWVDQFGDRLFVQTESDLYEYDDLFERWYTIDQLPDLESSGQHIAAPRDLLPGQDLNFVDRTSVTDTYNRTFVISDILDDEAGNYWISTWGQGTAWANSSSRVIDLMPYGLLQKAVTTIYSDSGTLWVSGPVGNSFRTGITAMDLETNDFSYIESGVLNEFPAVDVNCLEGDDKSIFIGTDNGLYVADHSQGRVSRHFDDRHGLLDLQVMSLRRRGDSLFIGTAAGLSMLRISNDTISYVYPSEFRNYRIYDMEIVDNFLWIGSEIGAYRLELTDNKLQRFEDPDNVLFGRVYDIELHQHVLWFASQDGILKLDLESGATDPYRDIVRRTDSRAIAVNDRIVALATDRGLTIIFRQGKQRFSRDFTTEDGLPSNYVYALYLDGDYVWVGTDMGLTRFLWNNPQRVD
jgi:ligand-binding sensor domain-containing protein